MVEDSGIHESTNAKQVYFLKLDFLNIDFLSQFYEGVTIIY